MQGAHVSSAGIVRFFTKDELKRYLKGLVDQYQAQSQVYGDQLGSLLRTLEQEKAAVRAQPKEQSDKEKSAPQKVQTRGWVKMGPLLVNVSDPNGAMAEMLFQLHEDVKSKLAKSTDALKAFEELSSQTIPEAGQYHLQLRNGVPERIVADLQTSRRDAFSFSADFKLV
jgi:hypothetical protein